MVTVMIYKSHREISLNINSIFMSVPTSFVVESDKLVYRFCYVDFIRLLKKEFERFLFDGVIIWKLLLGVNNNNFYRHNMWGRLKRKKSKILARLFRQPLVNVSNFPLKFDTL